MATINSFLILNRNDSGGIKFKMVGYFNYQYY